MTFQHHMARIFVPIDRTGLEEEFTEVEKYVDWAVNEKGYELVSVAPMAVPNGVGYVITLRRKRPNAK